MTLVAINKCWRCGYMHVTGCECPKCGRGGDDPGDALPRYEYIKPVKHVSPVIRVSGYGMAIAS